jgi:iron complex transport system substrate-binding protein
MKPRPGPYLPCWLSLLLCVCAPASAAIHLSHSDGAALELQAPAKRVVTLAPSLAELVYAAGGGEHLVATVEFSDYPEAASRLPRVGDAFRFDLERILALQPDLVIAWTSGNPVPALQRLESLGLRVWRTDVREPADIATLLNDIALATGVENNGAGADLLRRLQVLTHRYAGQPPVRYFYQVAEQPLFTLNGEHIISRGLALCGGRNVFADESVLAPQVSREAVLAADPAVLIAPRLGADDEPLAHWRDWPRLQAVQQEALVYLPADRISRATPRMLDSLETGCKLLHQFRHAGHRSGEAP